MILVDTSIWVDHLRRGEAELSHLLRNREVLAHPCVIGEVALGTLRQRDAVLGALRGLPRAPVASDDAVQSFIEEHRLFGIGIGYVDVHLLAATLLTDGTMLWTRDKRLRAAAQRLSVDADIDR